MGRLKLNVMAGVTDEPTQSSLKTRAANCSDTIADGFGSFVIRPTAGPPNTAILPSLVPTKYQHWEEKTLIRL